MKWDKMQLVVVKQKYIDIPWVSNVPFFLGRAQKKIYVPFLHNKDLFCFSPFRGYIRDSFYSMIAWHKHQMKGLNLELYILWFVGLFWDQGFPLAVLAVLVATEVPGGWRVHTCIHSLMLVYPKLYWGYIMSHNQVVICQHKVVRPKSRSFHWGTFWLLELLDSFGLGIATGHTNDWLKLYHGDWWWYSITRRGQSATCYHHIPRWNNNL